MKEKEKEEKDEDEEETKATYVYLTKSKTSSVGAKATYDPEVLKCTPFESLENVRAGNCAAQVGLGGGTVGSEVGTTLRSGGTPARDTRWLLPENISRILRLE